MSADVQQLPTLTDDDRSLEAIRRQLDEEFEHSTDVHEPAPPPRPAGMGRRAWRAVAAAGGLLVLFGAGGVVGTLATQLVLESLGAPSSSTPEDRSEPSASADATGIASDAAARATAPIRSGSAITSTLSLCASW